MWPWLKLVLFILGIWTTARLFLISTTAYFDQQIGSVLK
jgi:hypothetical protein